MYNGKRYTTKELETHIRKVYAKLEPIARKDGVYKSLDDYFDLGTHQKDRTEAFVILMNQDIILVSTNVDCNVLTLSLRACWRLLTRCSQAIYSGWR
jgi:hypothetical protein